MSMRMTRTLSIPLLTRRWSAGRSPLGLADNGRRRGTADTARSSGRADVAVGLGARGARGHRRAADAADAAIQRATVGDGVTVIDPRRQGRDQRHPGTWSTVRSIARCRRCAPQPDVPPRMTRGAHRERLEHLRAQLDRAAEPPQRRRSRATRRGARQDGRGDRAGDGRAWAPTCDELGQASWSKQFGRRLRAQFARRRFRVHARHHDSDGDDDNDNDNDHDTDGDSVTVEPVRRRHRRSGRAATVRDLGKLSLGAGQREAIKQAREQSPTRRRGRAPAARRRRRADSCRTRSTNARRDRRRTSTRAIDAVARAEAAIRKTKIKAWVHARAMLDPAQRQRVEQAMKHQPWYGWARPAVRRAQRDAPPAARGALPIVAEAGSR